MEAKELLIKLSAAWDALTQPNPAPAAPVAPVAPVAAAAIDANLEDGTSVRISNMQVGGTMSMVAADGTETPAVAGEYTLSDGTSIEVAEGGVISSIEAPEPAAPAPAPAPVAPAMMEAFEKNINELKAEFEAYKNASKEVMEQMFNLCQELAKQPTAKADPSVESRTQFQKKDSLVEKCYQISKFFDKK